MKATSCISPAAWQWAYVLDTWIKPCRLGEDNTYMQEEQPFNRTLCNICMYSVIFVEDVYTQCAHTHVHEFIATHVYKMYDKLPRTWCAYKATANCTLACVHFRCICHTHVCMQLVQQDDDGGYSGYCVWAFSGRPRRGWRENRGGCLWNIFYSHAWSRRQASTLHCGLADPFMSVRMYLIHVCMYVCM